MRYTVVLRGARGSSGPLPQALIKVEKRGAVPRPQNLRMGEGGPRWEARHSCGLPLSLCGAHDPRRATLVTSPAAAHTLTSSCGGGGELRDRSTWSESNSASRGATQGHASARIRSHSEGGGGKGPSNMVQEQPSGPRRHSCGVPRREYARSLLARHQQQSRSPPVAASAQGRAFVRGGISLMWPPPTRQTQPSAASRPIAHPPVQQSSQGLRAAYVRGGTSLMRPPLTRHTHSP